MRAGYRSLPSWKKPAVKRRRRRILLGLLLAALAATVGPLAARPAARALGVLPPFQVRGVEVTGLLYLSPEEVRAKIPVRKGDNLLLVSPAAVEAALRANARVAEARVSRRPGTLAVRVTERRTFVLVNTGSILEVDPEGIILSPLTRGLIADRPVVTGLAVSGRAPGTRVTGARFHDLLRLVALLEAPEVGLVAEVSEIAVEGPGRVVLRTSRDPFPIYVDPERATLAAMRAVAATLRDVRERARPVTLVDARYRGQVIVRCAPERAGGGGSAEARGRV